MSAVIEEETGELSKGEISNDERARQDSQQVTVALAGNPNCGKTTLFNALTGLRYKVANYPGVTVEKKLGKLELEGCPPITLVDLPGIYSLDGSALDERIATSVLLGSMTGEKSPDALVVVVDGSNLDRNLYLTTQLIDCGIPIVVALNMLDIAEKKGLRIHGEILSRHLDVPIVNIQAHRGAGIPALQGALRSLLRSRHISSKRFHWLNGHSGFRTEAEIVGRLAAADYGTQPCSRDILLGAHLLAESSAPRTKEIGTAAHSSREQLRKDGLDPLILEATARYEWIHEILKQSLVQTGAVERRFADKIDNLITHRVWGTVIFVSVMTLIFQSIFLWAKVPMDAIQDLFNSLGSFVEAHLAEGELRSLLVNGVIAGVGNVVVFVPQIAVLFFFLGLLEDSGYLARAAFLMDRLMRPFGLQGRSFIPLLSSFACAIPGIMSTRTIPSWSDRLTTILVAPLMSCSARLPVYTVLIAAFIPEQYYLGVISLQGLVLLGMYLLGIVAAAGVSWILKHSLLRGAPALFVMEMPPIRRPVLRVVAREVFDRVVIFLRSAGTIILACSIVLWFLASYPKPPEGYTGNKVQYSYAGRIGTTFEPVLKPMGFNWEIGVGIIASFAAREVFVSALSTVYNLEKDDSQDEDAESKSLIELLQHQRSTGEFSTLSAISLMVFYVFACQCMSTLAVVRRETGSWGWTFFMFLYMTIIACAASLLVYQGGLTLGA